jgi:cytochrome c-type biogenesis protein CcmH/NrfG
VSAISHYRRALELDPNLPAALVDLAWILATSGLADIRAPLEAVRLAERAVQLTDHQNSTALDTLATAYAAAGDVDRAIATAERALAVASVSGPRELVDDIRARLARYKQKR